MLRSQGRLMLHRCYTRKEEFSLRRKCMYMEIIAQRPDLLKHASVAPRYIFPLQKEERPSPFEPPN